MTARYLPLHTLRCVCQLCGNPQYRKEIPIALAGSTPSPGGCIVMLLRPAR
jgi:hypothetical protein